MNRQENNNISTKLTFLLAGGGIGALLALLFAPKSGAALRQDFADAARQGAEQTSCAATQLKQQATNYYEAAREKVGEAYQAAQELPAQASEAAARAVEPLTAALEAGQKAYRETGRQTEAVEIKAASA